MKSFHPATYRVFGFAFLAAIMAACAPLDKAAPPVCALTLPKKTNVKELAKGRDIYAAACTRCHGPARIDKHGDDKRWAGSIMPRMCGMSKLSAEDTAAVTAYVLTARHAMAAAPAH